MEAQEKPPDLYILECKGECINLEIKLCRPFVSLSLIYNFQCIVEGVSKVWGQLTEGQCFVLARYLHQLISSTVQQKRCTKKDKGFGFRET